jgi:hypothetical protein
MRRPSIIAELSEQPEPAVRVVEAAPAPPPDLVRSSIYLSRAAHDRLREIAFAERKKIHDLIVEGIDQVIATRGHRETARRQRKL